MADKDPEIAEEPNGSTDPDVADESAAVGGPEESTSAPQETTRTARRRVSVSVRTVVVAAVIVSLIAATGVMTWLYIGAKTSLDDQVRQAGDDGRAEQVALDYAVGAAIIDFQDLAAWKKNLVENTTPELKEKLTEAAKAMEQILVPMQWKSTAKPLAAKVRSNDNGIYIVDAFVSVRTKTTQTPEDNLQSTATYSLTIDSNHDWQISDVGGIAAMVGEK